MLNALLPHRGAVFISGADAPAFLQALMSNDATRATDSSAIYAALLTPQGKFLHDLFILRYADGFLLDCETARADDLIQRLNGYKLRSKISLQNLSNQFDIWAGWPSASDISAPAAGTSAYADPRLPALGYRAFVAKNAPPLQGQRTDLAAYDNLRFALGVADGSRDLDVEKSTLAEANFDCLNGIDWKKGCYIGQELTARMHYRGLAKKRLLPVSIEGDVQGERVILSANAEVGQLRSHNAVAGLALLSLETVNQRSVLTCGKAKVFAQRPLWMQGLKVI